MNVEEKEFTISVCMIVKNEEEVLARGLECIKNIADEIIIVDTGSTDRTVEIAKEYTQKVYSFEWIDDFAAARNFSFSKATMDYIYVADADEILDEENQEKFAQLKMDLDPQIEVVQMMYCNQLYLGTTYNFDEEYRPKLYKRIREFQWIDQVHETVLLDPIIYDSDIRIIHMPTGAHGQRDFETFQKLISRGEVLSNKLHNMYAKELFIVGEDEDFLTAQAYFEESIYSENVTEDKILDSMCVLARCYRITDNIHQLLKVCIKGIAGQACSELCCEIGNYFYDYKDYQEAILWYENAAFETESRLNITYHDKLPYEMLVACAREMNNPEMEKQYKQYL